MPESSKIRILMIIENLRNLPSIEEFKTQIVLDKIKEDPSVIIPG